MRILHTSDWHYGRSLKGVDLTEAHDAAAREIAHYTREHDVDVVVVAGDVYDRAIPHNDAVMLLDRTLQRLCPLAPVIITPGNHDSATRLGFASAHLDDRLHISADIGTAAVTPIVMSDEHGQVAFYALPFMDPDDVRYLAREKGDDVPRSHAAAAEWVMRQVHADIADRGFTRSVVIAHEFVIDASGAASAEESESERDLTAGGLDYVPTAVFDGVSYVALGHLHGAQNRAATPSGTVIEYSGSPLRFSFSERNHRKSVTLVDLDAAGAVVTQRLPITQPRGMAQLTGTLAEVISTDNPVARDHRDDWVDITITDTERPERLRDQLIAHFPYMLSFRHEPEGVDVGGTKVGRVVVASSSPIEVMSDFVSDLRGTPARADELEVLQQAARHSFEGVR